VGIEIPQKQNRRKKLTNKVLELSDIACCRGERYMEHMVTVLWKVALRAMACRPVLMFSCW